jgi:hypothetical protein
MTDDINKSKNTSSTDYNAQISELDARLRMAHEQISNYRDEQVTISRSLKSLEAQQKMILARLAISLGIHMDNINDLKNFLTEFDRERSSAT